MKKILKSKKGFTLIEMIVVLVVLAILAAAAIPTMIGFVEDSKGKALVAEGRAAYIAAQAIATQEEVMDPDKTVIGDTIRTNTQFINMLLPDIAATNVKEITVKDDGQVTKLRYEKDGYTIVIEPGKPATAVKTTT